MLLSSVCQRLPHLLHAPLTERTNEIGRECEAIRGEGSVFAQTGAGYANYPVCDVTNGAESEQRV